MYYVKHLPLIPKVIKETILDFKIKHKTKNNEKIQIIIQLAKPHFGNTVKQYVMAFDSYFNYQESLKLEYFEKSKKPDFGVIYRKLKYNQVNPSLDEHMRFKQAQRFAEIFGEELSCCMLGLDYVVDEKRRDIWIIDVNSFPGLKVIDKPQIGNTIWRKLNEMFGQKFGAFEGGFGGLRSSGGAGELVLGLDDGVVRLKGPGVIQKVYKCADLAGSDFGDLAGFGDKNKASELRKALIGANWTLVYKFGLNNPFGEEFNPDNLQFLLEADKQAEGFNAAHVLHFRLIAFELDGISDESPIKQVVLTGRDSFKSFYREERGQLVLRIPDTEIFELVTLVRKGNLLRFESSSGD